MRFRLAEPVLLAEHGQHGKRTSPLRCYTVAVDANQQCHRGYATAARTQDGRLAIIYAPTIRPLTIDMTRLSGPVTARWFDP
jgi:hypothetical protein